MAGWRAGCVGSFNRFHQGLAGGFVTVSTLFCFELAVKVAGLGLVRRRKGVERERGGGAVRKRWGGRE